MTTYTRENEIKKNAIKLVKRSYIWGFIISIFLAIFASFFATYINQFHFLNETWIKAIQIISVAIEAAAMFGVQGWERGIQTWGRESKPEKLSQRLFKVFSATGFFLVIFSFQLMP